MRDIPSLRFGFSEPRRVEAGARLRLAEAAYLLRCA